MGKTILIHTIGNRDWQFPSQASLPVDWATEYLEANEDDPNNFKTIKKRGGGEYMSFRTLTGYLERQYFKGEIREALQQFTCFPMLEAAIEKVLEKVGYLDEVFIWGTLQSKPHPFDTHHVVEVACQHIQGKYGDGIGKATPVFLNPYAAPASWKETYPHAEEKEVIALAACQQKLADMPFAADDQVFVSHRQGLPNVTWALTILGFYQGYTYLSIDRKHGAKEVDYGPFERFLEERRG